MLFKKKQPISKELNYITLTTTMKNRPAFFSLLVLNTSISRIISFQYRNTNVNYICHLKFSSIHKKKEKHVKSNFILTTHIMWDLPHFHMYVVATI